jgi:hypothetical protein
MALAQIYSTLTSNGDVSDIIGDRLFPLRMPRDGALPAAVFQLITTVPVNSLDGDSGLDSLRIQIKAWAARYADAHTLADAIRAALRTDAALKVTTEFIDDDQDEETLSYCVILQFSVWSTLEDVVSPITAFEKYEFTGDGVTTEFTFPLPFRTDSLLLFKNGIPMKAENYSILAGNTGVSITPAPEGGGYPDEFLAYYAED